MGWAEEVSTGHSPPRVASLKRWISQTLSWRPGRLALPPCAGLPPMPPRELPPVWPRPGGTITVQGGERFDWEALVPLVIHPLKVAILEALEWIGQPLSAGT